MWLPSRTADLDTADRIEEIALLRRDTTTLVMHLSLPESLPRHSQVVRTSIASANLEAPVGADDLDPPEVVPGLNGKTVPQWRRRGFARALVEHVLADARAVGARTATLQSTPMGRLLYESLGFTAVGRYEEWVTR